MLFNDVVYSLILFASYSLRHNLTSSDISRQVFYSFAQLLHVYLYSCILLHIVFRAHSITCSLLRMCPVLAATKL
jgi:hypothetical protein